MTVRPDSVMALAPGDFVDPRHGLIHSAIMAVMLRGAAIDPVTVCDQLDRAGELHAAGGKDYLGFLIDVVPGSVNPASYVSIVRERAQRRRIASQLETVAASVALAATPLVHVSARIEEIGNAVGAAMLPVAESLAATPELDPVALYGIIGDWVRLVAPHTE
ncbi:MAG TPA: DnaB-like helicase N-terminal domain-containing protein, partial [Gemmatimonadaceae bacterium]